MFIWRVQPGVLLVRTRPRRCIIALSMLDLPTFERPAKAISTSVGGGIDGRLTAPAMNFASTTRVSGIGCIPIVEP